MPVEPRTFLKFELGNPPQPFLDCDREFHARQTPPTRKWWRSWRGNARALAGIDPTPVVSLGGTDARLWRYKDVPATVYGPSPTGMGSVDEHVTVAQFLHVVRCHALSAFHYMSRRAH